MIRKRDLLAQMAARILTCPSVDNPAKAVKLAREILDEIDRTEVDFSLETLPPSRL